LRNQGSPIKSVGLKQEGENNEQTNLVHCRPSCPEVTEGKVKKLKPTFNCIPREIIKRSRLGQNLCSSSTPGQEVKQEVV